MSTRLLLVLVVCCGCGRLVKPAEVELVWLTFPGKNMVDLTVLRQPQPVIGEGI